MATATGTGDADVDVAGRDPVGWVLDIENDDAGQRDPLRYEPHARPGVRLPYVWLE